MIVRTLGAVGAIVGGGLIYMHLAVIADPAPGVTFGWFRQYIDLILGVPIFTVGVYYLVRRRRAHPR